MSGVDKMKALLGQASGPEVELVVTGTRTYATYETLEGFPAVYDDEAGLYCYAMVVDGRFRSTSVPVSSAPPEGVTRHAKEAATVRSEKIATHDAADQFRNRKTKGGGT